MKSNPVNSAADDAAKGPESKDLVFRGHAERARDWTTPPELIWEAGLQVGGIVAIVALPGEGKTLFALALAEGIAGGIPVGRLACKRGRVVYFAIDAPGSTERRLLATDPRARDRILTVLELSRLPAGFGAIRRALRKAKKAGKPFLALMIDTYDAIRTHDGGGFSAQDALAEDVLRGLRDIAMRFKLVVVVLHHATRNDHGRARGTVVFDALMDFIGIIEKRGDIIELRAIKNRDGECGHIAAWRIGTRDVGGRPVPVLIDAEIDPLELQRDEQERAVLSAVHALAESGADVSLRPIAKAAKLSKDTVARVIERLRAAKRMHQDSYTITAAGTRWLDGEP